MGTKNLVIVESPAKAKTIERFLGKDYLVKSSFGHVMDLSESDLGVDVENGFTPQYSVSPDKKKIVGELKKLAAEAETVWLATDEDREGEAISWHLVNALDLNADEVKRIVFHEITKTAITQAIESPRRIDRNLVDAQTARRVLDRLVGYELSPLLWKKVKPALSAGRVQSVAVRLIVEREEEIKDFKSTSSFRLTAKFYQKDSDDKALVSAELPKRFATRKEAEEFLNTCIGAAFSVAAVEKKPAKKSPAPPFTTSTLQQEASRKLGFPVAYTMRIAQQLYESGLITYMRTDSVNLSNLAMGMAKETITKNWGAEYVKTRKYATKSKGAQEAHEAIRPTYIQNDSISGDKPAKRLYDLIWKRTIASQMADAKLEKTNVNIDISTSKEQFVARGEVITFDGFLKVYIEGTDDAKKEENGSILPPLSNGDVLLPDSILATQRFTMHPQRYTEASLVKKMEELGIGRPSTYAPTISTIQKREYVKKNDKPAEEREFVQLILSKDKITEKKGSEKVGGDKSKLIPTDLGTVVNSFLMQYFEDILDYNFTAGVEKEFDQIADGQKEWNKMIDAFYGPFHEKITQTQEKSKKFSGEKLLGTDPKSGNNIYVKIGKYGPMVQMGDASNTEKPRFAGLKKGQSINDITLEEALALFNYPKAIGEYEGEEMLVALGRFGPYIRHNKSFYALDKGDNPSDIDRERAIEIILAKREEEKNRIIREYDENKDVKVLRGRYGPYISIGKKNFKIPKGTEPESLSLDDCIEISKDPKNEPKKRKGGRAKKS
ncbi:MAG: type I DNA topoisomerase [Bacteroidales bacterium]|nr:type I DNA topoisomerase [Bacteroidales bacterium]